MNLRRVRNLPLNDLNDEIEMMKSVKDLRERDAQSRPENFFPSSSKSRTFTSPYF